MAADRGNPSGGGRIREDDIAEVREKARIDDVVSSYVTLRKAGGGSFKGLCPFHDEKTPSFNVTPARQRWHCFGCGEGGDVFDFLQKHDGLSFTEAVERLADKYGVRLRREAGDAPDPGSRGPRRSRLLEAHKAAQEFYAESLAGPDAMAGRQFLAERDFDQEAARRFGVGFAPRTGDALYKHLRGRGFTDSELLAGGLVAEGRGYYDRFRGRLLWPIRESSGETIGFGARRIFDDDRIEAKYLNTPETPIYKKSQVLYGIDLARRDIARSSRAVVVEGYTDVMACHLAGVPTAVATCGTAFGDEHARVLRRFLHDHEEFRGEVIFTFDGDEAGQKAALRAFAGDQNFVSQTYVAVEPNGLDPCELRIRHQDEAVRDLVARRVPLYRFVLNHVAHRYDLDRADGRVDALREAARLVTSIRDRSKVDAFTRELAQIVGVDVEEARLEVRRASQSRPDRSHPDRPQQERPGGSEPPRQAGRQLPNLRDPRFAVERDTLKLILQHPAQVGAGIAQIDAGDFAHPVYRAMWQVIADAGGPAKAAGDPDWIGTLQAATTDDLVSTGLGALCVEPGMKEEATAEYIAVHLYRLQELTVLRRIAEVKSKLQRTNPTEKLVEYNRMFGELTALEQHRRQLREKSVGA
ncbi:MAG: DNA primase [Nocardioides sp.]